MRRPPIVCPDTRKYGYPSRAAARKRLRMFGNPAMEAYWCASCHRWHIGHSNADAVSRREARRLSQSIIQLWRPPNLGSPIPDRILVPGARKLLLTHIDIALAGLPDAARQQPWEICGGSRWCVVPSPEESAAYTDGTFWYRSGASPKARTSASFTSLLPMRLPEPKPCYRHRDRIAASSAVWHWVDSDPMLPEPVQGGNDPAVRSKSVSGRPLVCWCQECLDAREARLEVFHAWSQGIEREGGTSAMPLTQQIMRGSAPRRPDRTIRTTRATPA